MDDAFELRLLEKLPLAQGVFHLFSYALDGPFLEGLFEAHRGRCYKRVLSFPQLVYLVRDALMCDGSGHRAMARAVAISSPGATARLTSPPSSASSAGNTRPE